MARNTRRRSRSGRSRRRRGARRGTGMPVLRIIAVGAGVVASLAIVAAVAGPAAVAFLDRPEQAPVAVAAGSAAEPLVRGVIVDPSGSNGGADSARQDLALLADTLETWPGPQPPDNGESAYPGAPGLDLTVRQVALNSYEAAAQVAHIQIPSVAPLQAAPESKDVDLNAKYLDEVDRIQAQYRLAKEKAQRAAKQLRSAPLRSENSEIAGSLSALVQVLPRSELERRIIVISDVEQAGASPQVDGALSDTTVTVFQRCDDGADQCERARASFTALTRKLNGTAPEFQRIENLPTSLGPILKGE